MTRENAKAELVFALAQGISIPAWARAHGLPKVTVYRWAKDPKIRKEIDDARRRKLDRVVGQMVKRANWAVGGITELAKSSESDSVKLRALRSILIDMIPVSKYTALECRLAEMEERLAARQEDQPAASD